MEIEHLLETYLVIFIWNLRCRNIVKDITFELSKNGEYNEVQDDFELICFDLVSSPSTPGSYLFKNPEDANKWDEVLESKEESNSLDIKANKALKLMSKLNNFLDR